MQNAEPVGCCNRWDRPDAFNAPDCNNLINVAQPILSVTGCVVHTVGNMHNWVMAQNITKWVKIPAITFLATLMIPAFLLTIVDASTRVAIWVLTMPLVCMGDRGSTYWLAIGYSATVSFAQLANAPWTMINMYMADKNINAWEEGAKLAKHVTIENMVRVAVLFFVRR